MTHILKQCHHGEARALCSDCNPKLKVKELQEELTNETNALRECEKELENVRKTLKGLYAHIAELEKE
jgi:transcription initiation factor IIE alpha subunit